MTNLVTHSNQQHHQSYSLIFLDGLRGLAALYVMVGHARWLLWEGYGNGYLLHSQVYNPMGKIFVYLFSTFRYGHEAVLFFFVLSGFVIHLRYSLDLKRNGAKAKFDWLPFIKRRVRRLYPPLLFAMIITLLADRFAIKLGYQTFRGLPIYLNQSSIVDPSYSLKTAVGNMLFLMDAYVPVWGTNGPLWSLKCEWWFYMIYPLFWVLSRRSIGLATAVMLTLFCLSFLSVIWPMKLLKDVFSLMVVWWLGVLLADIYTKRIHISIYWLSPLMLLLPLLVLNLAPPFFMPILWGMFFSGLICFCFFLQSKKISLEILNSLKWLGDMSYTLYVVHFPLLLFMSGWLIARSPDQKSLPTHFNWVFAGIILCVLFSYVLHFMIEKPFISRKTNNIKK